MPNGHFDTLEQDAPHNARVPAQPTPPQGHISHQHGYQEFAIPGPSLRGSDLTDAETEVHVSGTEQSGQSPASVTACQGTEHQVPLRDSFSDFERSPYTVDNSFLPTTSSTEHEKEPGETGVMQAKCALVPPRSPEMTAGEPNPTCTGGPAHAYVALSNDSASSGPICRICHEGEQEAALLSMCKCSGSLGLVHVSCLERWLNARNADDCELCHHRFPTTIPAHNSTTVEFFHWLLKNDRTRCAMLEQLLIFLLLPLIAVVACYLSEDDDSTQDLRNQAWLGPFLVCGFAVACTTGLILTAYCHYLSFLDWISENQIRRLLLAPPAGEIEASDNRAPEQPTSSM